MSFLTLITQRQSVRKYSERPVEKEKLLQCIEALRLSPSACNSQPWIVIAVDDPGTVSQMSTCASDIVMNKFALQAKAWVVLVIEPPNFTSWIGGKLKDRNFPLMDIGIAANIFCMQATELGLGTCMIGWFNERKVKEHLKIPKRKRIALLIAVGYSADGYKLRSKIRKSMNEMCHWNKY